MIANKLIRVDNLMLISVLVKSFSAEIDIWKNN